MNILSLSKDDKRTTVALSGLLQIASAQEPLISGITVAPRSGWTQYR
jgi:hypothetical protein